MLENRNLKLDLLALALLAAVIFLGAALFSYDPADPPTNLAYPAHGQPANMCGHSGAIASRLMFEGLGLGAYYLLVSLAAFDFVLLVRHELNQFWLRAGGWLLSLAGVATLAAMAVPSLAPGPAIGAGGYLGAIGRAVLEMHFASLGAYIVTVSMIIGGLLLATDYWLIRLSAWIVGKATHGFGRGIMQVGTAYARKVGKRRSDLDDFAGNEVSEKLPIRMSGRPADEQDDEEEEEHEEEKQTGGEETDASDGGKARGSRVGISRPKTKGRQKVLQELDESDLGPKPSDYELPSLDLLLEGETVSFEEQEKDVRRKAKILEKTFADFGFNIRVVEIQTGPVIAQFEVELEAGLRLSKITGLADDLAIALRVPSVRIVAPAAGQEHGGRRSAQQRAANRPPPRGHGGVGRQGPENADSRLLGQGRGRLSAGGRSDHAAAPAHCRAHGHGQERLPELDHRVDADDPPARRSPHVDDRPENGRAQPLPLLAAPDAPGGHRHAEGRGDPGLGGRKDGGTLSPAGPRRRAPHQRLQPVGRRGTDGAHPSGGRRGAQADSHRTCPTSSSWRTSWPT